MALFKEEENDPEFTSMKFHVFVHHLSRDGGEGYEPTRFLTTCSATDTIESLTARIEKHYNSLFPGQAPLRVNALHDQDEFLLPGELKVGEVAEDGAEIHATQVGPPDSGLQILVDRR